jgi:NTE family protein
MRIALIIGLILSLFTSAAAERLKVGLVLSGGGARGAAHVGIIRYLEEKNIPIDAICGTSMGALVGGMYASGLTTDEIQSILSDTQWSKYISYDEKRDQKSFREKSLEKGFPSTIKVGVNENDEVVVGLGLFKRHEMITFLEEKLRYTPINTDFDRLRIPFRAIATNLSDGKAEVLKSGSLAESMYASFAIPGAFEPIVINGKTLVDGGIADNLPVEVMRQMGVDVIIAVDISTPFKKDPAFDTYFDVMSQLTDILARKNVENTIASLGENEILITPDLDDFSSMDTEKSDEIVDRGYQAAMNIYTTHLARLSVEETRYAAYRQDVMPKKADEPPVITRIELDNRTYIDDRKILSKLRIQPGDQIDYEQLREDIQRIYDLNIFDDVKYKVIDEGSEKVLKITAAPKWDINGQIKFGFGFQDDFDGHSDYSVRFEYLMTGINAYGAQWRTQAALGVEELFLTEFYQPIDVNDVFYIRPQLFARDKKIYISPSIIGGHTIESDLDDSLPAQAREYGGVLYTGINITNDIRLQGGVMTKKVSPEVDFLLASTSGVSYESSSEKQHVVQGIGMVQIDSLDDRFFPTSGMAVNATYKHQIPEWGSENEYDQFEIRMTMPFSYGDHTLVPLVRYGSTFNATNFSASQDFNAFYTLGGLFNMSGLPSNALSGDHVAFGSVVYRYELKKDEFLGQLSVPLYLGVSYEYGRAWYQEYSDLELPQEEWMHAGALFLGADTILGPFYIGVGHTEGAYYNFYLMLGESF